MRPIRMPAALAFAAATVITAPTFGSGLEPEVVAPFDAAAEELPEGISIDQEGVMFVTLGPPFFVVAGNGWIKRIGPDGTASTLAEFSDGAPAGIVVGPGGDLYYARPNPADPENRGVYRLDSDGNSAVLPGTEEMLIANGLALDGRGGILASDSATGSIWRVPLDGSAPAEPWFSDQATIGGCGGEGEVGANGVALWEGDVFVANTSRGLLVRIPVAEDGSPGTAEVVAGDATNECEPDALFGMDGIAFDVDGNVYALLVLQNQLVRIDPSDGSFEVLLSDADGLHNPASLAFGTTDGERETLYIANYAVLPPVPENGLGPAVLKVDVGVAGAALP